ncbi:MAG: response regulator [Pseudomonadota bacterium]
MGREAVLNVGIVDDDVNLCRSLGRLLRAAGIHSVAYSSGEIFLADEQRSRFHCLLLDVQLGGMSGIELERQLASEGSTTPIIYITAQDGPTVRAEAQAFW